MGLWPVQCNDITKVLIAAGRARQRHQQFKIDAFQMATITLLLQPKDSCRFYDDADTV
jgi:hypothetical protein